MSRITSRRPTPAMVVAVIALALAIAGSAAAGTSAMKRAVTTSKVREIAKKQASKAVSRAEPKYQLKADLLAATVAPADAGAGIVSGRGATAVTRVAPGFFNVTFNRRVSGCTATATYGRPLDVTGVDSHFATVRGPGGGSDPNTLGVVLWDDAGNQEDGQGFHVIVLCP